MMNTQLTNTQTPINIIFLDIDGVLNFTQSEGDDVIDCSTIDPTYNLNTLSKSAITNLNSILDDETFIVISSTWRKSHSNLDEVLYKAGVKPNSIIGCTPILDSMFTIRGNEIYGWISMNKPIVKSYVILDDDSDMLLWQRNHYINVDNYCGLTPNVAYKARRILDSTRYIR